MALEQINLPDDLSTISQTATSLQLINLADNRSDIFVKSSQPAIHNYVPCDFHLVDQALTWILDNYLLTGNRFCELGSGMGVAALLASNHRMESVGIEIEPTLVEESCLLARELVLPTRFYCGSFVPRNVANILELSQGIEHVVTDEGDVYDDIGLAPSEFDLFFAFPWPGERHFFEAIFQQCAADGACLLTYEGREGLNLVRKI